jgi:MFS family permease
MIVGISLGTIGMAILGISSNAWVFIGGMIIFSIGEMTAHPKFISYVGLIAPPDKKALYLGYSFLYGVIGSGIGGILGASLYVFFVEKHDNAQALWFIFSLIGVATIIGLLLYNKFLAPKKV